MNGAIDTVFDVMSGIIDIVEAHGCKDEEDIRPWLSERLAAYASQKSEIERLRAVISKCADALGNGAYIAPTASVDFMERLPLETSMRIATLSETSNGKD